MILLDMNPQYEYNKQRVYDLIACIPKGKVTTYGRIAKKLSLGSPRLVGRILHQNPDPKKYPCHRVVFADGSLASGYAFGGEGVQKKILLEEGVEFNGNKVSTAHFLT